jgi:hypothetical protein
MASISITQHVSTGQGNVDLTAVGADDWAVWGSSTTAYSPPGDKKSGGGGTIDNNRRKPRPAVAPVGEGHHARRARPVIHLPEKAAATPVAIPAASQPQAEAGSAPVAVALGDAIPNNLSALDEAIRAEFALLHELEQDDEEAMLLILAAVARELM